MTFRMQTRGRERGTVNLQAESGVVWYPPLGKSVRSTTYPLPSSDNQLLTMSMLTAISVKEGEFALEVLPTRVQQMQTLLDSKFAYASLSEVER